MKNIAKIRSSGVSEVLYDEAPIGEPGGQDRGIYGYLPQEFGFNHDFTVRDYFEYVAAVKGPSRQQGKRRIDELLEQVS